ncbi:MAG: hypothetical protein IKY82_07315 [Alistipes sp.]|nr:hypothetical protein [Alistipes sp.]
MKKCFSIILSSILLGVALIATSCSKDDTAAVAPSFPKKVTKSVVAGEVVELSFEANYAWTATISQNTYSYFQLLNGTTTTNTLSGGVGKQTIKVNVASATIFDKAPVAEVTLTMNGESAVIAQLTYPTTKREFAVYAPVLNEYGAFSAEYAENALATGESLLMLYGTPELGDEMEATFYTPAKVVANYAYTLVGPEWLQAVESGEAGETEFVFKADNTKIPASTEVAKVDVMVADTDDVVASFDIKIQGVNDYLQLTGFAEQAAYTSDGKAASAVSGVVTAGQEVVVKVCDENGAEVSWIDVVLSEWDAEGAAIQDRMVSAANVEENTSASSRKAYIFLFAKNDAAANEKLVADGVVAEEYAANLATIAVQYTTPATIAVNGEIDDTCASFAEASPAIDYWFTEGDLQNLYIGSKYDIMYFGPDAKWGSDNSFVTSRPIAQFKVYSYTVEGSFVELTDGSWIECDNFFSDEKSSRFKIETNIKAATAEGSLNVSTGDYEAVILVEYTDGSYSGIYFHYNEAATASSDEGVAFVEPELAEAVQASLKELKSGDELYETYFAEYSASAMPAKFYHLTYQHPLDESTCQYAALTGLSGLTPVTVAEWLTYNEEMGAIIMDKAGADSAEPGAVVFKDGNMINKVVILCTLMSKE